MGAAPVAVAVGAKTAKIGPYAAPAALATGTPTDARTIGVGAKTDAVATGTSTVNPVTPGTDGVGNTPLPAIGDGATRTTTPGANAAALAVANTA